MMKIEKYLMRVRHRSEKVNEWRKQCD